MILTIPRGRGYIEADNTSLPSGGISTFGPLIVEAFGFNQFKTILFNIPFGAVQLVATLGGAWLATKLAMKGPVLILLCLPSIAGCVMLLCIPRGGSSKGALLAGYYIVRYRVHNAQRPSTDVVYRFRFIRESVCSTLSRHGLGLAKLMRFSSVQHH